MSTEQRIPTTQRLADALREAHAPEAMIAKAELNYYDEFNGPLEQPIVQLVQDCQAAGLEDLALRAMNGEFDSADWESAEWLRNTREGQMIYREFFGPRQAGSRIARQFVKLSRNPKRR